jgi:peptide deformylase
VAVKEILLLGNEKLYQTSLPVLPDGLETAERIVGDLRDTMAAFRQKYGFGRAIAAPQIGEFCRILYLNADGKETAFLNPEMEFPDGELFTLWDDCMSFPGLEVRVRRYRRCRITFRDLDWNPHVWEPEGDFSELLQHEYDHLDGILAVQRAVDGKSFRINRRHAGCY